MKESKFYHKALDMALLDGKAMKAALDKRTEGMAGATRERGGFPWQRVAMTAVACVLLLFTVVIAIPFARAEVLSWLGIITRPKEYLTANPSERPTIEVLDNMIATAKPEDTEVKVVEIDRTNSKAVNSEGALKVAELLGKDVRITIGDTLYDGSTAYVSLRLGGTAALPLLDSWTGGSSTLVKVDPQRMYDFFAGGPGEEYLSGEKTLYWRPTSELLLEFDDGSRMSGFLDQSETETFTAHWAALEAKNFHWDDLQPEELSEIDRMNQAFLEKNEIVAYTEMAEAQEILEKNADENGEVTAKAWFNVFVEEDYDLPATELLSVEAGTVRFNVTGYKSIETRSVEADQNKMVWQGDTVLTYMELVDPQDHDKEAADWNTALQMYTNYPVSLDGMTLEALPGARADNLGIYDLNVRITLPDSIQGNARAAWSGLANMFPVSFDVLLDGQSGDWTPGAYGMTENEDGTFTYHILSLRGLDLETITEIKTVTLIPVLRYVKGFDSPDHNVIDLPLETRTPLPKTADGVWMGALLTNTQYPEYAVTFTLG